MNRLLAALSLVAVLAWIGVWLWALRDAASYNDHAWQIAGESRGLWLLGIVVLQLFGTLAYLFLVRPKLRKGASV